ncbi:MAG: GspE/PulE family protein, partial [Desulfobulbia bacterium]
MIKTDSFHDNSAGITRLVDIFISQAIAAKASDIHFEPTENALRVRYRIDGILYDKDLIQTSHVQQLVARLKILSHIDVSEKRMPQDGKFKVVHDGKNIDLRVSTFPSIYGEKVVVRILDRSVQMIALNSLGFAENMLVLFDDIIRRPHGFLLVTGPTGSGKTTTLYGALSAINSPDKNIITLEDPVEYSLPGIVQGQIHEDAGFTFEKGVRALLRQDPDVVMVGEIRDQRTARIAREAALTGHFVLSTLHTRGAPDV